MSLKSPPTMLCVGDLLISRDDPPSVFQHVGSLLRSGDFTMGNLEGPIAESGVPLAKVEASSFKSDSRQIAALESAGFTAMTVANNHMLDFGYDALFETLTTLDRAGITQTGGGRNFAEAHSPAVVE